jgi:hypothetical protein
VNSSHEGVAIFIAPVLEENAVPGVLFGSLSRRGRFLALP